MGGLRAQNQTLVWVCTTKPAGLRPISRLGDANPARKVSSTVCAFPVKLNTEEPNFQLAHIISGTLPAMQLPEARSCLEHGVRRHVRRLRVHGRAVTLRL